MNNPVQFHAGHLRIAPAVRIFTCAAFIALLLPVAEWFRPTVRMAEQSNAVIHLADQVPDHFGDWVVDKTMVPILPSPDVQASLDAIYTQVLARTYVNGRGERIMLSIAYGSDQGSEATAVHRPEFCYSAQGFKVENLGAGAMQLDDREVPTRWLLGTMANRVEPISYWVTLDRKATLPGLGRKIAQLNYGLRGLIPDGMLVRISNISKDQDSSFRLHQQFAQQLKDSLPADLRNRYFGQ